MLFKILQGNEINLPEKRTAGYCYFLKDTHYFYVDYPDSNSQDADANGIVRAKLSSEYADKLRYYENNTIVELDPRDIPSRAELIKKVLLTQAEYDALPSKDPNTLYIITDAPEDKDEGSIIRTELTVSTNGTSIITIPSTLNTFENIMIYHNGILLVEGINYSKNGSTISLIDYTANSGDIFTFINKEISAGAQSGKTNIINITIPEGRMKGDINGDGFITSDDSNILGRHVAHISYITDEVALLAADIDNDGSIDSDDNTAVSRLVSGFNLIGQYGEITGNWTSNPNYETESYQFYTDIAIDGMTTQSSAIVYIQSDYTHISFSAECIDGAIRIYANLCPISAVDAMVQYGAGNGTAIVVGQEFDPSKLQAQINELTDSMLRKVELTQAEYDALIDRDPNVIYIITDKDDADYATVDQLDAKQNKITGTVGQFVIIGSDGNVTTKTIPYAEEASF